MFKARTALFLLALTALSTSIFAQFRDVSTSSAAIKVLPVSEVREGMRGTARSVFRGDKSEEFSVEILGVVPNWIGPRQDLIVGKLSGANAERTFVFAGMSGSPVYIDGKLVGAISYSFPFAKEPICGITPFEQMTSIMEQGVREPRLASKREPKTFTSAELLSNTWTPSFNKISPSSAASGFAANSRLMSIAGESFRPIATPVTFSGISKEALDLFAPAMMDAGLMPVAAAGGSSDRGPLKKADETTLRGGDSVVVALARGDVQIAAAGTVTLRDGDKIYAFGHPFFSLGGTNLPMSESHVVTVVPNANNSFKLAVADSLVGTMTQDRNTGIYGLLGQSPKMVPVKIRLTTSNAKVTEINFETAIDETLTPLIVNAGVASALSSTERSLGETTFELNAQINAKGVEPMRINRRYSSGQAMAMAASATAVPLSALLRAGFDDLELTSINIDVKALDGSQRATLERVTVDRSQVHAGDTVELTAFVRTEAGKLITQRVPVVIPRDVTAGQLSITISDGSAAQASSPVTNFTPLTTAEMIGIYNRLRRPDRLYAMVTRSTAGTIIGTSEMPNLPPSMLATINNDRSAGGVKAAVNTLLAERELPASEFVASGTQTVTVEVVR